MATHFTDLVPLTHKYMATHFTDLVQVLQLKVTILKISLNE